MLTHPPFQLCLAHYCDFHGPTPLMVTEGLPVPCSSCNEDDIRCYPGVESDRPRTSARTPKESAHNTATITEALRRIDFSGAQRSSSLPASEQEAQTYRAALRRAAQHAAASGSAVETPPQSPRLPQGPGLPSQQKQRHEFRRTYDEYVTRRAGPCENCALTLPKRQEADKETGADARPDRSPTLRTRAPCARVFGGTDNSNSPSSSQTSSSSPSEDESITGPRQSHRRTATTASVASRSSTSSAAGAGAHTHYLDYTSTHEPLTPASFSIVRASCLRTLSLETLPRAPATGTPAPGSSLSTPCASPITPAFVTTHSAGSAASGGPIFFGDPVAGYTTAYIFRIPDIHARGHKRVYAFLALSTHRERLAMKTFAFVAAAFRDMAAWIQARAEAEAERTLAESSGSSGSSPIVAGPGYGSFQSELPAPPASAGGSSFLMGGGGGLSRRMGGGFGGSGAALKPRGLAELVGLPDFFIEMHSRFVRLLLELGVMVGS
ncbi:vesicle coat protein [Cercophora newfieldiana]|uniref:Vesicle coat protein n=1 Tax=Cercophora newfieldiana TaxID=92897 RepID=A0AA39YB66_9PEZI|nr:vesicle coat protein [Cercophora newfieldiana]